MGIHSADFKNFKGSQTISLASSPKFAKNYESTTVNIRMLGGEDYSGMESVESTLDSTSLKASLGERESVREGEESDFANSSPLPLSQEIDRIEDVTDSGAYALLSAVYYWNTKTYPNGVNVSIPAWRNFHLYEIADDEANGNTIIPTIDEDTQQEIDLTQAQRTISVLVNGGRKGLTSRRDSHNRIRNNQIFVEFDNQ